MEAKLCSVGANCREKTVKMPAKSEAEGKVVPMEEAIDCSLDNNGIKEATVVKDVQISELEGSCVMCEFGGRTAGSKSQSTIAENKSGDSCGASGNAGLRVGIARA